MITRNIQRLLWTVIKFLKEAKEAVLYLINFCARLLGKLIDSGWQSHGQIGSDPLST